MWVVLFHLRAQILLVFPRLHLLTDPMIAHGYLGVDLFFILSGFIISYNYAERFSVFRIPMYLEFLWTRLARLWPVHVFMLGLFAVSIWWLAHRGSIPSHPQLYSLPAFIQNLLLIHAWSIPIHESWNAPAWSISCEWFAYILFPVLVLSRLVTSSSRVSKVTAVAALLIMALILQSLHAEGNNKYGLIRISGEFLTGCCLCNLFHHEVGKWWNWNVIIPISLIMVVLLPNFILPIFGMVAFWCVPFLALTVLGLAYHRCALSRLLSSRLFLLGGYASYSLYMVHGFCLILFHNLFPKLEVRAVGLAIDLLFAVGASVAMFYFVEEPCRKIMRKLFFPRRS